MSDGIKHDQDKLPYYTVLCKQFPNAIKEIIRRSQAGHIKYAASDIDWKNWERVPDGYNTYSNALLRHFFKEGEDTDIEHDVAVAWNALARLELKLRDG